MVKLSEIATDLNAEEEGVWAEYVPGFKVKIASTATRAFKEAVEKAHAPYLELMRSDSGKPAEERKFTREMRQKIVREITSRLIVRDWIGWEGDDGKQVPYSPEKALEVLSDPRFHRLESWIDSIASSDEAYRLARVERDRKNS